MQIKAAIIIIISNYEVQMSERTPVPNVFNDCPFILSAVGGMWLKIVNRRDRVTEKKHELTGVQEHLITQ
jgi:hypothetical protein